MLNCPGREDGLPVAARGGLPDSPGLPVGVGLPGVPLHAVHPPLVRPLLHSRAVSTVPSLPHAVISRTRGIAGCFLTMC